jgi:hypothetical protein
MVLALTPQLKPHLRILHEMEAQAKRQMSQAILIYPGATTPTGSLTATPADSLDNTASQVRLLAWPGLARTE